jgi:hypothetical protein
MREDQLLAGFPGGVRSDRDPAPPCLLGCVERAVGSLEELFQDGIGLVPEGHTRRHAHLETGGEGKCRHVVHQLLGLFGDPAAALAAEDDHELVTAEPQGDPIFSGARGEGRRHLTQHGITCQVTMDVVDQLEVVYVGDDRAPGLVRARRCEG